MKFGAGQRLARVEDQRLITGVGRFTDDLKVDGAAHLFIYRSPHAHARIARIDATAALSAPGVIGVVTGEDLAADGVGPIMFIAPFKQPNGQPLSVPPRLGLARDTVRYVGEPMVAVIAESRAKAQDAAELLEIEFEELPAAADLRTATATNAPSVWPEVPGNVACINAIGDQAATDAAFGKAKHVAEIEVVNNRLIANALEPRSTIAAFDAGSGRFKLTLGCQNPTVMRRLFAATFGIAEDKIQIVVNDIGGGFGMKSGLYPEDVVTAYASRKFGRTVRWRADRGEEFAAPAHGRDHLSKASIALDAQGKILAMKVETLANLGAALTGAGALVPLFLGPKIAPSVYDIPTLHMVIRGVLTNSAPTGAYRGAGRPEAVYLMERLIEAAARVSGIDSTELRRRNMIRPDQMPFKTATGEIYDSGNFVLMMDKAMKAADWNGFSARAEQSRRKGALRGRGMAAYLEWTSANVFSERVEVHIEADGGVTLLSGTQAMGQGLETSYTQMLAAALEIDPSRIRIVQGDTDRINGGGSLGSRSAFVGGSAVVAGAEETIKKCKQIAADVLEAAEADLEYANGAYRVAGTDRSIDLASLASRDKTRRIVAEATATVSGVTWPNGCHVAEVEIDIETGTPKVVAYTTVDDVGTVINPMIVEGQIHGGIAQGIGQALFENTIYDSQSGQLVTGSFMDYGMPHADDLPDINTALDESQPCRTNPIGVKGCGEIGAVAAPPAVVNALIDALKSKGVDHIDMPVRAETLWSLIHKSG